MRFLNQSFFPLSHPSLSPPLSRDNYVTQLPSAQTALPNGSIPHGPKAPEGSPLLISTVPSSYLASELSIIRSHVCLFLASRLHPLLHSRCAVPPRSHHTLSPSVPWLAWALPTRSTPRPSCLKCTPKLYPSFLSVAQVLLLL